MVATKKPFGSISEEYIEAICYSKVYNEYYLVDKFGSRIIIDKSVYHELEKKGVRNLWK